MSDGRPGEDARNVQRGGEFVCTRAQHVLLPRSSEIAECAAGSLARLRCGVARGDDVIDSRSRANERSWLVKWLVTRSSAMLCPHGSTAGGLAAWLSV
jgi:hypothetical protein